MNLTAKFRGVAWVLWAITIMAALVGWFFFERQPAELSPVIGWVTGALFVGEGANLGKRATYRPDHHENSSPSIR